MELALTLEIAKTIGRHNTSHADLFEKPDLVNRALEAQAQVAGGQIVGDGFQAFRPGSVVLCTTHNQHTHTHTYICPHTYAGTHALAQR